jgi:hypothetical protein
MNARERIFLALGAGGLVVLVLLIGGIVYALLTASVTALRWWAGLVTAALPVGVALPMLWVTRRRGSGLLGCIRA